jgi:hypothetical protein
MTKSAAIARPAARLSVEPIYDVAISFLVSDEKTAAAIKSGLAGLKVFFYPHNQEELIGTNGMESMREPFIKSRVNVILFRERYGKTPWTGVELSAIQDNCLKTRYQSLVFVQFDKNDKKPDWLPDTHIRCILGDFTLEQVIGAIKLRVQELGGSLEKPSALETAKRLWEEELLRQDEKRFFRDHPFINDTARNDIEKLMQQIMAEAEKISTETGLQFRWGHEREHSGFRGVIRYGRVSIEIWWKQFYTNVIEDVALECTEYNGPALLRREGMAFDKPTKLAQKKFHPALNSARELRWRDASKPEQLLANEDVVQKVIEQFLTLVDRLNRGEIAPVRE